VLARRTLRLVVAISKCRPTPRSWPSCAKNFVALWSPSRLASKSPKGKPRPKIKEIADLAGHKVGVIGRTSANPELLRLILTAAGVQAHGITVTQFGTDQIEELARDPTLDAFMAVGPLDSKITSDAIAATARSQGAPKFLAIEASEAIELLGVRLKLVFGQLTGHQRRPLSTIPPHLLSTRSLRKPAPDAEDIDEEENDILNN
jgi:hypothetical protein